MTANLSNSLLESNLAEVDHSSHKKSAITRRGLVKRGAALSVAGQTSLLGLGMLNPGSAHANEILYKSYSGIWSGTVNFGGNSIYLVLAKWTNYQNRDDFWASAKLNSLPSLAANRRAVKYIDQGLKDYQFSNSFEPNLTSERRSVTFNPVLVEKDFTHDMGEFRRAQQFNWDLPANAYGKAFHTCEAGTESPVQMVEYFVDIGGKAVHHLKYIFSEFVPGQGWVKFPTKLIVANTARKLTAISELVKGLDLANNKLQTAKVSYTVQVATIAGTVGAMIAGGIAQGVLDAASASPWVIAMGGLALYIGGVSLNADKLKTAAEASLACQNLISDCRKSYGLQ